ncbi:hypothetical protein [Mesorhizobium sp. M0227]|uniref:hypothetical protein n=1 Tax=unclassified Mesorhizobium TaxID=325217 RepID=UPI00333C2838
MASSHIKYHAESRISANELARFMVSGDTGRMGIIKRAKEKRGAVALRYSDVRAAIAASMCDPIKGKQILAAAFGSFEQKASDASLSAWSREDASKSLDVMESFGKMVNLLKGFDFVPSPPKQPMLAIGGVGVSVNCDVLIHCPVKGVECIGAALFRLTKPDEDETDKAKSKRDQMGRFVATLVLMQVGANLAGNRQPLFDLCWSVDVQTGEIHKAPKNTKAMIGNMENACQFIAAMWDKV